MVTKVKKKTSIWNSKWIWAIRIGAAIGLAIWALGDLIDIIKILG